MGRRWRRTVTRHKGFSALEDIKQTSLSRDNLTPTDVAILSEKEALSRLDLLATASRILDAAFDDYDEAMSSVAEACVIDFADLCAIEVLKPDGSVRTAAYRRVKGHGLRAGPEWQPLGREVVTDRDPVLVYTDSDGSEIGHKTRERLGAESLIAAPVVSNGITVGWLVVATGPGRRGFRPSALKVAVDLSSRIASAIQRVMLHREMQASAREQTRTVMRLRRLATAATNLAGAATTQAVLETACREACSIHDADGAAARWWKSDGSTVAAVAGQVDVEAVEKAFAAITAGRVGRGRHWIGYPLPSTDPWQHGTLVVFSEERFAGDDEPVLSSLASLVPIAFERALGTEQALKHEARLRAVVDASPVALIELDPNGYVAMANRTAQELLGWGDQPGAWNLDDELRNSMTELAGEVLSSSEVLTRTVHIAERELSLSGAPLPALYASDGPSVLVAGMDLTEMRRAQFALVQAQRLEAMGQVAGRVAHDFNNLLTLIVGYAAILRRGIDDDKQLSMIANIEDASKRAAKLTQQMLDMTRQKVDSGTVIDLGQAVTGLNAVLSRVAGPHVDLQVRTSRNVIKVRLDPSEMEQIVVNLVINACDAMENEGRVTVGVQVVAPPKAEIERYALPNGPLALLTVTDSGPGMPPEVLARCLEPFFTTKDRGRGSGLGLPTVYGLVRERGGQVHIDSAPGKGTTIRIWLPLERDATVSSTGDDADRWPAGRTVSGRVLLVEDEEDLRTMAEESLTSIGLQVTTCTTAEEALERYEMDRSFDTLVTDVILPGMSGLELVPAIRNLRSDLPVVYMTGYTGSNDTPPAANDPVIRKPYAPDTLRLRVAEMVQLGRLRGRSPR